MAQAGIITILATSYKDDSMIIRTLAFFTLLFLCVHAKAQQSDTVFQKEWLDIDTLILKQDLTRTALTKTKLLRQKAQKRQLSAQVIKCLIYEYALEERITDEEPNKLFAGIQSAIKTAGNETEAAILHSLLARQYLNYYNNHRWNLYGRESGSGSDKNDIATWGTDELTNAISQHFLLSLRNKALLQQTKLSAYNAIILQGNNRQLRPTLFDLLAHEALDYFASGENYLNKPQYVFSIADPHALDGLNGFLEAVFTTKDSSDLRWQALQLYQLLLRFHRNDTNKESLVNTDLERIK